MAKIDNLDIVTLSAYLNALRTICLDIENNLRLDMSNFNGGEKQKLTTLKSIYQKIESEIIKRAKSIE